MAQNGRGRRGEEGVAHAAAVLLLALAALVGVVLLAQQYDTSSTSSGTSRPALGADVRNADPGALVVRVSPGGAAAAAKLESGDILVAIDDTNITTTTDLTRALAAHHAGDRVSIGFIDTQHRFQRAQVALAPTSSG